MDTTCASLLIRIRNRQDSAAWAEFDAVYRPILRRFARARGLDDDQVEDVVQHCMMAVTQHIAAFDYDPSRGRFKGWLRTLVNNHIAKLHRHGTDQQAGTTILESLEGGEDSPDALFDQIWQREHLKYCLGQVRANVEDATYRAFRAYALEEQPIENVCAELNMTKNQVQLIKWRITQMLRDRMKELNGDAD